jgi:hypothetical protein
LDGIREGSEETFEPGTTVSLVALTAAGSDEEVVPASDYRALQSKDRELHRVLGKAPRL